MQFRSSGGGDERRRRVFRDEMLATTDREDTGSGGSRATRDKADGRVYSDAALAQRQAPLTSLLPRRALTLVAVLLGGGLAIAGIELLYTRFFVGLPEPFRSSLAVFDLTARGNIADWFASLTLVFGAVTATLVYLIRRHRLDDYRGRYRIWQWATAGFVVGSFDAATGAHAILQPAMIELTGTKLLGDGAVWTLLLVGIAMATCLIRIAIEVRGSRLATAFLYPAAGSYIGFVVVKFHPELAAAELIRVVVSSATLLAGHFCLVYSVVLYGRHVYQEAQGTRRAGHAKPVVAGKSQSAQTVATSRRRKLSADSKQVRVDSAHELPTDASAPVAVPTLSKKSVQKTACVPVADDSASSDRPRSKSERRRLRKLERRQRRQANDRRE